MLIRQFKQTIFFIIVKWLNNLTLLCTRCNTSMDYIINIWPHHTGINNKKRKCHDYSSCSFCTFVKIQSLWYHLTCAFGKFPRYDRRTFKTWYFFTFCYTSAICRSVHNTDTQYSTEIRKGDNLSLLTWLPNRTEDSTSKHEMTTLLYSPSCVGTGRSQTLLWL